MRQGTHAQNFVPVVAVDGPSGAGKGTVCRVLAEATGFALLDSGALYRLTALAAMRRAISVQNEAQVAELAKALDVEFQPSGNTTLITLGGEDVTDAIRQEAVGMNASIVAAYPPVRAALLDRQRAFAVPPGLVADGRDMGTVVFPRALVKVFLTASAEERAQRRRLQLQAAGIEADGHQLLKDIQERDLRDSSRAVAPLKPAADAIVLDSTDMPVNEVAEKIKALLRSALNARQ